MALKLGVVVTILSLLILSTFAVAQTCGPGADPRMPCTSGNTVKATWVIDANSVTRTLPTVTYEATGPAVTKDVTQLIPRLLINGGYNAPAIHVKKDMQVELTVKNALPQQNFLVPPEPITLHFHGILMTGGQVVMDGPEGITQRSLATSPPWSSPAHAIQWHSTRKGVHIYFSS
jgi:FtsP/CotA-like multicopper oxidase with cupredoxin domain